MDAIYGSLAAESNTKNPVVSLTIESGGELKPLRVATLGPSLN